MSTISYQRNISHLLNSIDSKLGIRKDDPNVSCREIAMARKNYMTNVPVYVNSLRKA